MIAVSALTSTLNRRYNRK